MRSYFNRLIKQTGIAFRTVDDFRPNDQELSEIESETGDGIAPVHMEEERVIQPETVQRAEMVHDGTREVSEEPVSVNGDINIQHSPKEGINDEVREVSQARDSEREEPGQQNHEIQEEGSTISYRDIRIPPEGSESEPDISAGELLEKSETVGSDTTGKGRVRPIDFALKPDSQSDARADKEQIWQGAFKEVREWVAEPPVESSEEIKNKDASQTMKMERKIPGYFQEGQMPIASYPRPTESQQRDESEIHDFHLSIGTISLTIEELQKEVQNSEPPQVRERKPRPETSYSRLSRHYIGIR